MKENELNKSLHAGNCIRTYSGLYMNVFKPELEMICIDDIAHALSHMPRFGGHTSEFYSVAEHCIGCYHLLNTEDETEENITLELEILLHDASEAYLLDMPKPIKRLLPEYNVLEDNLMKLIFNKFGLNYPLNPKIKEIDKQILEWEYQHFMLKTHKIFKNITPKQSAKEFLRIFEFEMSKIVISL